MDWSQINWFHIAPEIVIFLTAVAVLIGELFLPKGAKSLLGVGTLFGLIAALISTAALFGIESAEFSGMFTIDTTATILKAILLAMTSVVVLASLRARVSLGEGEFFSLILFSVLGTMFMASSTDLIMLFIALELTVLPAYILTGSKKSPRSSEAALKYFLLGIVASVILLYGMTLVFGLTGQTGFAELSRALATQGKEPLLIVAMIMIVAGLGFKVAAVPFHFWAPDVYEGSPVPVASYLAVGPKAGGFAALIHFFPVALASITPAWAAVFAALAVLSMVIGNFAALSQTRIRRLLGYSAVAHTGYLLVGLAVADAFGYSSLIFYFLVYGLAALGAFLVILATTERGIGEEVSDFAGLSKRAPILSIAMAIFLFSLVGLPPFAGFMGKLYLFGAAVKSDLIWLAIIGVLNSVVSFGYYVTIIRQMYLVGPVTSDAVSVSRPLFASIILVAAAVVILGVYPTAFLSIINL